MFKTQHFRRKIMKLVGKGEKSHKIGERVKKSEIWAEKILHFCPSITIRKTRNNQGMKPPHSCPLTTPLALEFLGLLHRVLVPKSLLLYPNKKIPKPQSNHADLGRFSRISGWRRGEGGMTHSSREFGSWQLDPVTDGK